MPRKLCTIRPTAEALEDRVVLTAHLSAMAKVTPTQIDIAPIQVQLAQAYDTALVQVVLAEVAALTPGGPTGSAAPLQTSVTQALGTLSQAVGQIVGQVPGASSAVPLLQNEITAAALPGSLQQILGTIPNSIADTGGIGGLKQNLSIQITIDTFLAAKNNALFRVAIFANGLNSGLIGGPISNVAQVQFQIASAFDTALVQVIQAELATLTPGSPGAAGALQGAVTNSLNQLSQQVGQVLGSIPGAPTTLVPLIQTQILGTAFGSLQQVLGTIPGSIPDSSVAGAVKENLYIQLAIDAILSAKLAAVDDVAVFSLIFA